MNKACYDIESLIALAPESKGTTTTIGSGGLDLTLEVVLKTIKDNVEPFRDFAKEIQGNSLAETVYNIWHFLKTNTRYIKDKPLTEEIKSPARLIADKTGDCDDYSIFAATILKALGYDPYFFIVAFKGAENFGHIYAGVENFVIDAVMKEYGKHPEGITKTMIVDLNGNEKVYKRSPKNFNNTDMLIQQLEGLERTDVTDYVDSELERLTGLGQLTDIETEDLNKIRVLKLLEGDPYRDYMVEVMPDIAGIDNDFNVSFHNDEDIEEAEKLLEEYQSLQGLGDIDGLGKLFKKWRKNKEKRKARRKKIFAKIKKVAKKISQITKKVAFAPARAAFLLILSLNLFKWGSRIWLSYLPEKKARSIGVDMNEFKKLVDFRKKLERFWEKAGGKKKAIFAAVSKRGAKIAKKMYGISGLGVAPAAAAAPAVASPFLIFLKKIWGKVKGGFSNLFKKVKEKAGGAVKTIVSKFKDAKIDEQGKQDESVYNGKTNDGGGGIDPGSGDDPTPDAEKKSMLLPLVIGGALLALTML